MHGHKESRGRGLIYVTGVTLVMVVTRRLYMDVKYRIGDDVGASNEPMTSTWICAIMNVSSTRRLD